MTAHFFVESREIRAARKVNESDMPTPLLYQYQERNCYPALIHSFSKRGASKTVR